MTRQEPELAARMHDESMRATREYRALFEEFMQQVESGEEKVELTPEEVENLRALGYLD